MIEKHAAALAMARFSGMKGYDWLADAGMEERINALSAADDAEHLERVVTALQMLPMCPTVANIRREIAASRRSVTRCGVCEETGVEWIDSTVRDGSGLRVETWRACNCDCEWAVHLRGMHQRDREREAKKAGAR